MPGKPSTQLVPITRSTGVELSVYQVLKQKPGRLATKLDTLYKYLKRHPRGWKKHLELAELLYSAGRWEESIAEYRYVVQHQPQRLDVWLKLGQLLQLMGQQNLDAIAAYENALSLCRNVAIQHHIDGLIKQCQQQPEEAIKAFEAAAALEPEKPVHWLVLGKLHLQQESPKDALNSFEVILAQNPDDFIALNYAYKATLLLGDLNKGEDYMKRALELAPQDSQTLKQMADLRCTQKRVLGNEGKQTWQLIQKALKLTPTAAGIWESLAYYHLFRGERDQGIAALQQFTETHPNNASGWYYYGRCLFHSGKALDAIPAISRAHQLCPHDCEIYRINCEVLSALGRQDELQLMIDKMLEQFPEHWSVWVTAGWCWVETLQELESGCLLSAKGPKLQPQLADAWFRHGRILALAGNHDEAIVALEQGWQYLPRARGTLTALPAAVWLGESYQALEHPQKSRYWLLEAIEQGKVLKDHAPTTAHYWSAIAFESIGEISRAVNAYQMAMKQQLLYPIAQKVQDKLSYLSLSSGC